MQNGKIAGIILIVLGLLFLVKDYLPLREFIKFIWPFILIIVGIYLLSRDRNSASANRNTSNRQADSEEKADKDE